MRMHSLAMESVHASFSEYQTFMRDFKEKFAGQVSDLTPFFIDTKNIAKYYHWHAVLENRLNKLKEENETSKGKVSRREQLKQALEKIPNPLSTIQNPLKQKESSKAPDE